MELPGGLEKEVLTAAHTTGSIHGSTEYPPPGLEHTHLHFLLVFSPVNIFTHCGKKGTVTGQALFLAEKPDYCRSNVKTLLGSFQGQ